MTPAFQSSHFILATVIGAGSAIGLLHLWLWFRGRGEISHLWVAAFCASSALFQAGRYLEIQSRTTEEAVFAGRFEVMIVPVVIFCLLGFARSLRSPTHGSMDLLLYLALTSVLATIGMSTNWMISDESMAEADWFGHMHESAIGKPGLVMIAVYALVGFVQLVTEVKRSARISNLEKQVVIGSVAGFAVFGLLTIATAMDLLAFPALAQYGPLLIAFGITFLLVHQHGRMSEELEVMAEERSRRLEETDARYRQLVDNSPIGIVALDAKGRLLAVNPRLCDMLGLPRDLMDERRLRKLSVFEMPDVDQSSIGNNLRKCLESGRPFVDEFEYETPGHGSAALRIDVAAIRDTEGKVVGVQAIVEDIGARQSLEEKLRQSRKMEAVGGLAAGIAHEINNPMSYVRTNLSMLQEDCRSLMEEASKDNPAMREKMQTCGELIADSLEGVERTVTIVREVNEFAHGVGDNKIEVDPAELLEDALRMAEPQLEDGISVVREIAPLPKVQGSPGQIRQVFLNLIVNAIHAIEDVGTITLEAKPLEQEGEVSIQVRDDGGGIDPRNIDRVFDPFFTTKQAGRGTGLGLYICYEIVRLHDGSLTVESDHGKGANFEIRLPIPSKS